MLWWLMSRLDSARARSSEFPAPTGVNDPPAVRHSPAPVGTPRRRPPHGACGVLSLALNGMLGGRRGAGVKVGVVFVRIDKSLFLFVLLFIMSGAGAVSIWAMASAYLKSPSTPEPCRRRGMSPMSQAMVTSHARPGGRWRRHM
jgi:hypothetical protein